MKLIKLKTHKVKYFGFLQTTLKWNPHLKGSH